MAVHVSLLGAAEVHVGGARHPLPRDKRGALLAYLAYTGDWVDRERLAFLFWPDSPDKTARRNLRQLVARVKTLDVATNLEIEAQRLRWQADTDVTALRYALGNQEWEKVIALYRSSLCQDLALSDATAFDAWLELERSNLAASWKEAALNHADELEREQRHAEAATLLSRLLEQDDLAEDILQSYLRNAYLAGKREDALRAYGAFAARLEQELGLEPLEGTQELQAQIRESASLPAVVAASKRNVALPLTVLRPPKLIAREVEVDEALVATTPLVLITGEAGIGKSRFAVELAPGALVLRCQEGLQQVPYHPIPSLVHDLLDRGVPTPELGGYQDDLLRLVPEIAPKLKPTPLDPQTAKVRLLKALVRYLMGVTSEGNFQLVFDDLQWADSATLELLIYLSQQSELRILGTYRSDEIGEALAATLRGLRAAGTVSEVTLAPLNAEGLRELLADLSGVVSGPETFSRWLARATGGNPMFALEVLKSLFETGMLRADESGWRSSLADLTIDYRELPMPKAIAEVIARRVARLPEEARRVLQAASVLGKGIDPHHLGQIAGLSSWAVLDALEAAEQANLIQGDEFPHDLVRQGLYATLSDQRRRLLHTRTLDTLERTPKRVSAAVLAHHARAAGMVEAAVRYGLAAGDEASNLLAYEDARGHYQQAIELLAESGPSAERVVAHERLGDSYLFLGHPRKAEAAFEKAFAELPEDARVARARLRRKIGNTWGGGAARSEVRLRELDLAEVLLGEAPGEGVAALDWWREFLEIALTRARKHYSQGDLSRLSQEIDRLAPVIEGHGSAEQRENFYNALVLLRLRRERYLISEETWRVRLEATAAAKATSNPLLIGQAHFGTGFVALWRGDLGTARRELEAGLAFTERTKMKREQARVLAYLGILERRCGHLQPVRAYAERTLEVAAVVDMPQYASVAHANLAWAAWREGDAATARRLATEALDIWQATSFYPFRWLALFPLLAIVLLEGKLEQAAQAAADLLEPSQMKLPAALERALVEGLQAYQRGAAAAAKRSFDKALALTAEHALY